MSSEQRTLLVDNIASAMKSVPEFIQARQVEHFRKADKEYGDRVAKGLAHAKAGSSCLV
jgi:catalase